MNTNPNIRQIDNPLLLRGGSIWNRLHSEREDICSALIEEVRPDTQVGMWQLTFNEKNIEGKNREQLHSRLRQLDDALDRLMAGSYGDCSKCGRWIEDTRLATDPAISLCIECQQRVDGEHHFQIM